MLVGTAYRWQMGQTVVLYIMLGGIHGILPAFLYFFKKSRKKGNIMKYLVDHDKKFVHEIQYATNRCKAATSLEGPKEYTNSGDYVSLLETEQSYMKCPYCHEVPLLMD